MCLQVCFSGRTGSYSLQCCLSFNSIHHKTEANKLPMTMTIAIVTTTPIKQTVNFCKLSRVTWRRVKPKQVDNFDQFGLKTILLITLGLLDKSLFSQHSRTITNQSGALEFKDFCLEAGGPLRQCVGFGGASGTGAISMFFFLIIIIIFSSCISFSHG